MEFEDEVEQSNGRPCRQSNGRSKRTCELTSSIVPRGTSFHRWVDLKFPPIAFDPARPSCRCDVPGPAERGAVNPDAVHDHRQAACQGHDRLFHAAAPVRLRGQWLVVPDAAVVAEPNRFGPAVVWPYQDADGATQIRCFMPGAGI
jgi:hypothetical protein